MTELKHSLARNTVFNILGYFWTVLLAFVLTPVIVHFAGLENYGLYVLLSMAFGWFWILDLGIGTAATCFLSRYAAERDEDRFRQCLSTVLGIKAGTGLLLAAAALLGGDALARRVHPQDPSRTFWIIQIMVWTYALGNFSSAFNAALAARQRMDIPVRLGLWLSLPVTAAGITALALGFGLPGFLCSNLASALIYLAWAGHSAKNLPPGTTFSPRHFRFDELSRLLSFSARSAFSRAADMFFASADRLALGNQLHLVSLYQIGASPVGKIRDVTALAASGSLPAITDLHARGDWPGMNQVFRRGTKYLLLLGLPPTIFAVVFAEEILTLWMGAPLPVSAQVLRILAVGYLLNVLAAMAAATGAAVNRPGLQVRASLGGMTAAAIAFLIWGHRHGPVGLAASVSLGFGLLGILLVVLVLRVLRGRLAFPLRQTLGAPLVSVLFTSLLTCLPAKWISMTCAWATNRPRASLFVGCTALAALGAYGIALKLFRVLDAKDWETISLAFRRESPPVGKEPELRPPL